MTLQPQGDHCEVQEPHKGPRQTETDRQTRAGLGQRKVHRGPAEPVTTLDRRPGHVSILCVTQVLGLQDCDSGFRKSSQGGEQHLNACSLWSHAGLELTEGLWASVP